MRGWFNLPCWNGLSPEQQRVLSEIGTLPIGWSPPTDTPCQAGAQVEVTCQDDEAPGPRFYCYRCAAVYLHGKHVDQFPGLVAADLAITDLERALDQVVIDVPWAQPGTIVATKHVLQNQVDLMRSWIQHVRAFIEGELRA